MKQQVHQKKDKKNKKSKKGGKNTSTILKQEPEDVPDLLAELNGEKDNWTEDKKTNKKGKNKKQQGKKITENNGVDSTLNLEETGNSSKENENSNVKENKKEIRANTKKLMKMSIQVMYVLHAKQYFNLKINYLII